MFAGLDDPPLFQNEDGVRPPDRFQMMRDHDGGSAFHQSFERLYHQLLRRRIESRGRFVKNQNRRIADDRSRNRYALALSARKRRAALADHRFIAIRQSLDEFMRIGQPGGAEDLFASGVGFAVGDVPPEGGAEKNRLLQDETYLAAQ